MAVDIPHFSLPFRFEGTTVAMNEQDTIDEVADCVEAVLRCPIDFRVELPEFGSDPTLFEQAPIPLENVRQAVLLWEPRADADFDEQGDPFDEGVRRVRVSLTPQGD